MNELKQAALTKLSQQNPEAITQYQKVYEQNKDNHNLFLELIDITEKIDAKGIDHGYLHEMIDMKNAVQYHQRIKGIDDGVFKIIAEYNTLNSIRCFIDDIKLIIEDNQLTYGIKPTSDNIRKEINEHKRLMGVVFPIVGMLNEEKILKQVELEMFPTSKIAKKQSTKLM